MIRPKKLIHTALIFFTLLFASSPLFAQGDPIPSRPAGYVNDYAHLLSSTDSAAVTRYAKELEDKTTAQIAVVTVQTTYPDSIHGYSVRLFDKWKMGQKGKDNGLLILVAVKDRKAWITTGYGLEGAIPDYTANKIVNQVMIPYFKKNDYSQGIKEGAITSISLIAKEYNTTITGQESRAYQRVHQPIRRKKSFIEVIFAIIFMILIFGSRSGLLAYFLLGSITGSGRRRGGYWYGSGFSGSSGGFGGGFGGFGGGMTGGGGGGGSW